MAKHTASIRRFASPDIVPSQVVALRANHPALTEGRTTFPSTVVSSMESGRFLVSGHNNPKLGKAITKGPRTGWPIYHLTLEERATCPRSCAQWATCYGTAMPFARRHTPDADFLGLLKAEVATVARQHPAGLLVRLHTLGDFYSVEYVLAWAELLARFPQLHCFGYTARRVDDGDPLSRKIALAIGFLTDNLWDRFAIRTSHVEAARQRSIVVDVDPEEPGTIVCPAQTHATEACATCGLCWADSARDKTIAFLRHGMKSGAGPRLSTPKVEPVVQTPAPQPPPGAKSRRGGALPPPMPPGAPQEPGFSAYQTASMGKVMEALEAGAEHGKITISFTGLSAAAGVPNGSISFLLDSLAKRGLIAIEKGIDRRPNSYTILKAAPAEAAAVIPQVIERAPVVPSAPKVTPQRPGGPEINLSTAAPPPPKRALAPVPAPVAKVMREAADLDLAELAEAIAPHERPEDAHDPQGE